MARGESAGSGEVEPEVEGDRDELTLPKPSLPISAYTQYSEARTACRVCVCDCDVLLNVDTEIGQCWKSLLHWFTSLVPHIVQVHANSFVCRVYTPSATNYSLV